MKILGLLILGLFAQAIHSYGLLPEDIGRFRVSASYTSATDFWLSEAIGRREFANSGKTQYLVSTFEYDRSFENNLQLGGSVIYTHAKTARGMAGGSVEGDKISRISALKIRAAKGLFEVGNFSLTGFFEFTHPVFKGPDETFHKSPDTFISPSDGSIHYDFSLNPSYFINSSWQLSLNTLYRIRSDVPADQYKVEFFSSHFLTEKLSFGYGYSLLRTVNGLDLGSADFAAEAAIRGALNSRINAFSLIRVFKEGAILFSSYQLEPKHSVDILYFKSIKGRNTDVSSTITLGYSYLF